MICPKCKGKGFIRINGHWAYPRIGLVHFVKGGDRKCRRCKGTGFITKAKTKANKKRRAKKCLFTD